MLYDVYVRPNSILLKVKDLILVSSLIISPFGSHPKGLFLFHNLKFKIMKTLYKIIITVASKSMNSLFQSQKMKLNNLKNELNSKQIHSLLSQMYSAENEILFI